MQVEYALDIVWKSREALAPVDAEISRQAIHTLKAPEVAGSLGRPLPRDPDTQAGSDFHTRVEGARVKHFMGPASLKLYDKHGRVPSRQAAGPELAEGLEALSLRVP